MLEGSAPVRRSLAAPRRVLAIRCEMKVAAASSCGTLDNVHRSCALPKSASSSPAPREGSRPRDPLRVDLVCRRYPGDHRENKDEGKFRRRFLQSPVALILRKHLFVLLVAYPRVGRTAILLAGRSSIEASASTFSFVFAISVALCSSPLLSAIRG
jgi:hypothetical protein